jgi:hypothetical protein
LTNPGLFIKITENKKINFINYLFLAKFMVKENLMEWYINYVQNRDLMLNKISSLDKNTDQNSIIITNKDGTKENAFINEEVSSFLNIINPIPLDSRITIAVLNKKKNIDQMISEWNQLSKYRFLTIIFINPISQTDTRWIIKPYLHDLLGDKAALKPGIMSIASSVDFC